MAKNEQSRKTHPSHASRAPQLRRISSSVSLETKGLSSSKRRAYLFLEQSKLNARKRTRKITRGEKRRCAFFSSSSSRVAREKKNAKCRRNFLSHSFRLPQKVGADLSLIAAVFCTREMADDFERAILYAFDHTGAVGPELKVNEKERRRGRKRDRKELLVGHLLAALFSSSPLDLHLLHLRLDNNRPAQSPTAPRSGPLPRDGAPARPGQGTRGRRPRSRSGACRPSTCLSPRPRRLAWAPLLPPQLLLLSPLLRTAPLLLLRTTARARSLSPRSRPATRKR